MLRVSSPVPTVKSHGNVGDSIGANLGLLDYSTVIDVAPHSAGKTTRLAKWLTMDSPIPRVGVTVSPNDARILKEAVNEIQLEKASPMGMSGPAALVYDLNTICKLTQVPPAMHGNVEIGVDGFHQITQRHALVLAPMRIGYVTINGSRPYTGDRTEYQSELASKLRLIAEKESEEAAADAIRSAANILDSDSTVTDILTAMDRGWEFEEDD